MISTTKDSKPRISLLFRWRWIHHLLKKGKKAKPSVLAKGGEAAIALHSLGASNEDNEVIQGEASDDDNDVIQGEAGAAGASNKDNEATQGTAGAAATLQPTVIYFAL
jgi:hypothetical protein